MSEVVFVGTSDAFGAGGRRQSAVVVRVPGGTVLMDCGATTNSGLSDLNIERDEIDAIVVSHFHGDHFGGIPLLLLAALYEDRRTRPLRIAGPPEIERRVRQLAAAMGHSIEDQEWTFDIQFLEVPEGASHEVGPVKLHSFETRHQLEAHPHGYILESPHKRLVYSGDTGWFDELPRLAAGSDLFICECTYHRSDLDFHLNLEQLTERRGLFDVGQMILTHLGAEMADRRGQIEFETADDGLRIKL
ncbi:MAG: MBL fold metallo-hydrolase [Proteobacteria bacterium]|nr:MBL fold metallo-hydrolase [Pseudomonadota bacterium]